MSGIVAVLNAHGRPAGARDLHRMVAASAHRGPDGCEEWIHRDVAMGLCAFATTAFTATTVAPLGDAPELPRIVADARIDNRDEVLRALGLHDAEQSMTDAALIGRAWERWGERCLEHLHGDFAFALWDPVSRTLFCARDRMGVKPLYFHHGDEFFCAASEIEPLRALPSIAAEVDEIWVGDYLAGIFDDTARTFHAGIRRLPPAHLLLLREGRLDVRRYDRLDPEEAVRLSSDAEYAEAFLDHFTRAVRDRCAGPLGVAAALSGGLDSSSVVAVMRAVQGADAGPVGFPQPVRAFSIVFDDVPASNERAFIESVVRLGGIEPSFIAGDAVSPLPDGDDMIASLGQPFFAPNLFLHWEMFKAASSAGLGVWLDGLDGDTTVSHGMAYLPELARSGRWGTLRRELRGVAVHAGHGSAWRSLRRTVLAPLVTAPLARTVDALKGRAPWGTMPIDRRFAARIGLRDRYAGQGASIARSRTLHEDHVRRLEWGLHPFVLEMMDRAAAAHGIEPRYPFYDWRLIRFCCAIPSDQKLRDGWGRFVLRRAMQGLLPPDVQWRTSKGNPGPNFHRALRMFESDRIDGMMNAPDPLAPYVDIDRLRALHERWLRGAAADDEVMALWKCLTLWPWLA